MANPLIKPIKKAIAKKYGFKNVSVKNGTGTAWGWVHITINNQVRKEGEDIYTEALKIAQKALQDEGLKAYTYLSDDGYGTENDEILVQVNYKEDCRCYGCGVLQNYQGYCQCCKEERVRR